MRVHTLQLDGIHELSGELMTVLNIIQGKELRLNGIFRLDESAQEEVLNFPGFISLETINTNPLYDDFNMLHAVQRQSGQNTIEVGEYLNSVFHHNQFYQNDPTDPINTENLHSKTFAYLYYINGQNIQFSQTKSIQDVPSWLYEHFSGTIRFKFSNLLRIPNSQISWLENNHQRITINSDDDPDEFYTGFMVV